MKASLIGTFASLRGLSLSARTKRDSTPPYAPGMRTGEFDSKSDSRFSQMCVQFPPRSVFRFARGGEVEGGGGGGGGYGGWGERGRGGGCERGRGEGGSCKEYSSGALAPVIVRF